MVSEKLNDTIVKVTNAEKTYKLGRRDVKALQGVSLEICRAEVVGLAGASGSGKSTLLNLIGGLDEPNIGSVEIFGENTKGASGKEDDRFSKIRAARMGFIFQNFNLIPVLTALENVEYSLLTGEKNPVRRRARAEEALQLVGLGEHILHRPDELSGGQRQRVAIARAIVHRPDLIIADEPTAALDRTTAREILELLRSVRDTMKVTIVMASHDPMALSMMDRVIYLADGLISKSQTRLDSEVGT